MKENKALWASISILIGAVIAVLAVVRGAWQLPLLIGVFALWGLWVLWTQLLPASRIKQAERSRAQQEQHRQEELRTAGVSDPAWAQTLLRHVNYRISAYLQSVYPDARWEWGMDNPALFAAQGGTGRIRVYGIPEYELADVDLDQKGRLACSLVKVVPVAGSSADTEKPEPQNAQPIDPQVWYETMGRSTLEALISDLASRGHSSLTMLEDGSIHIQTSEGQESRTSESLKGFPAKVYWPRLVKVLEQEGLAATAQADRILVAW